MKTATRISFLCFLLFIFNSSYAQKQGIAAIDSMKLHLPGAKPDTNKARIIYSIANAYTHIETDSAMAYATSGLALVKKLGWEKGIAAFYNCIGNLYSDNANYKKALEYYKASYTFNKRIGNLTNASSNLNNIGSLYQRQANYVMALDYHLRALKVAEDINSTQFTGTYLNNVAQIYFSQKDYAKALLYHFKALKNYQEQDDKDGIADVNNSIGNVYHEQKNYKEADSYYKKALASYQFTGNKLGEASVLSQTGLLFENDLDKKLEYLIRAQQIFDKLNPLYGISITNVGNIGETYADILIKNNINRNSTYKYIPANNVLIAAKAEEYLNKAISYSRQANDTENLSYFSNNLARLQEKKGDFQRALQNYKLSRNLDDSLYSQESKNKLAALEAQYTFRKKEDEYKQQQQISQLKMRQILLYAILSIVLISSILIYFLNRSRINQLRLKNELQKKEAEEQTKELLHRNKLSESELKAIRSQMNPHFIFNVLNSIESYILENDSKTASRLVQKFASLSRLILENSTQSLVTADREWKALKLYTELEAMRFNDQFNYTFYADPNIDLSTLMLPPMLVQPIIENSILHGLRNSPAENNYVSIRLEQTDTEICFTIEDNGIGIEEAGKFKTSSAIKSKSIGLSGIRERIEIINIINEGRLAAFEIYKKNKAGDSGTIAVLTLPKIFRAN